MHLFFRERGMEKERERDIDVWEKTSIGGFSHALKWGPGPQPRPDWELNQQPYGLQAGTQSTEPHQPGLTPVILLFPFSVSYVFFLLLGWSLTAFFCVTQKLISVPFYLLMNFYYSLNKVLGFLKIKFSVVTLVNEIII